MSKDQSSDTVSGEIIRIFKKKSKYGNIYYDVHFKLLNTGSFYRSCIYPECRNFSNWETLLSVGNILKDLELFYSKSGKLMINADSWPVLIRKANPEANQNLRPIRKPDPIIPEVIQCNLFNTD